MAPSMSPTHLSPDFKPAATRNRSPSVTQPKLTFVTPQETRRQSLPVRLSERSTDFDFRHRSPSPTRPLAAQWRRSSRGSPPPPSAYENRVSFDTFDNPDAGEFSLTLRSKHLYYEHTESSRTFLFGFDRKDYSEDALEWLFDELIEDGDEVICLRVLDKDDKLNNSTNIQKQKYRREAHSLMKLIQDKVDEDKSISLVLEFAIGKVPTVIRRMTDIYDPTCLVVGTRGRPKNGLQNLLPGSISKDCLQNSVVPVLVVPPSAKREKKKRERQAKPSRRSYMEIVEKSDAAGSLTMSNFERGRSRSPHVTASTVAPDTPDGIAAQPSKLREESKVDAFDAENGPIMDQRPSSPSPKRGPCIDKTPTQSPKQSKSPDLPILRVNSEDID